jgi:serine/threonine protein kinase
VAVQYDAYCRADRVFYESLDRLDDTATRFSATGRTVPAGWERHERSVWIALRPTGMRMPQQGWKIHVSSVLGTADEVVDIVWNYCVARSLPFKFLRSRDAVLAANAKYADRGASGKLLAIYPRDNAELERTLTDLHVALNGHEGPYILSDLRWKHSPLYVRYGGFVDRYCLSETGESVLAVENPEGELVPDARVPVFQIPAWVEVPDFLAAEIAAHSTDPTEPFPYQIEEPLHFSNGGGVYLASEPRTGRKVVLREARPFAGLDVDGSDAVTRLHRERAALEKVGDLDFVPELLGYFTVWEHHYLVEEYIEGATLKSCMAGRYPLTRPDADENALADYTTWALDVLDQVESAVQALHSRGLIFGDLHPGNVMIRPDGRVALVDFEGACSTAEERRLGLGAAGFVAREIRTGTAVDRYALDCLRLAMFLPLTTLLDKDPAKARQLVAAVVRRFPVPAEFAARILDGLLPSEAPSGTPPSPPPSVGRAAVSRPLWDADEPDWSALRASVAEGILASATPERGDRLFPGDINQFRQSGLSVAYGAAGVLYALSTTSVGDRPELVDWLIRMTRRASTIQPGLYDGLHGIAYVLEHLGHREEALNVLDRALEQTPAVHTIGLFGGLAGIGLNLLHFAATGARSLREEALRLGDRLAGRLEGRRVAHGATPMTPHQPGLMHGFTGPALFFLRLYEATADVAWLDLAAVALRCDLAACETSEDTLQMRAGSRLLPYLAHGSAGLGIGLAGYSEHRRDEEFTIAQRRIRRACQAEFVIGSGLFTGRAGLIAYLSRLDEPAHETSSPLGRHLRRLAWHAVPYQDHLAFPGEYLFRLSMDVATGSAGVLLAMDAALGERSHALPLLDIRRPTRSIPHHTGGR